MVEYLIALGCVIVVMLLSWVWIIVNSLLERLVQRTRVKIHQRPPRLVCSCPKCHSNLYQDVKAVLKQQEYAAAFLELKVVCDGCQTESIWLPLGDPPELKKYRARGSASYRSASGLVHGASGKPPRRSA